MATNHTPQTTGAREGREAFMATAFLFSGSNGLWIVQSLGSEACFGHAVCGATFCTKAAAVAFLTEWGFEPAIGDGTWMRG
tara:strand:+ start:27 stop:269 length:243 start_codon:yes stop_codon:yes gene_type:complete